MFERALAKRHITHLDLDSVRLKVMTRLGWDVAKTDQVELEYRRFLFALSRKHPGDSISPPTVDVDEFWHHHILDTRRYRGDCEKVFGHYMDHTPGLGGDEQSRADERRRQVYAQYNIDSMTFDSSATRSDGGFDLDFDGGGDGGSQPLHMGHAGDGHGHGGEGACGHGDGGSDSGGDAGGDGGGGDGGGGCGSSCGGGCGGGCGSG